MSDADRLLADLWAEDQPPERDIAFVLAVMEQVERRRFWLNLASLVPAAVAGGVALWALSPQIVTLASALAPQIPLSAAVPVTAAGVTAAFLWAWVSDRLPALAALSA